MTSWRNVANSYNKKLLNCTYSSKLMLTMMTQSLWSWDVFFSFLFFPPHMKVSVDDLAFVYFDLGMQGNIIDKNANIFPYWNNRIMCFVKVEKHCYRSVRCVCWHTFYNHDYHYQREREREREREYWSFSWIWHCYGRTSLIHVWCHTFKKKKVGIPSKRNIARPFPWNNTMFRLGFHHLP
jgi:hypothetical protein